MLAGTSSNDEFVAMDGMKVYRLTILMTHSVDRAAGPWAHLEFASIR